MSANVALSDTFDTWRVRTNTLLEYTQNTVGGSEEFVIANTSESSSITTGSLVTSGGAGIAKSAYIGNTLIVANTTTINGVTNLSANVEIGSSATDVVSFNATLDSNIVPNSNGTSVLGNTTNRFSTIYTVGVVGTGANGSLRIPVGTTAQREGNTGSIRYNTTLSRFEGNTGTNFVAIASVPQDQDGDTKITVENSTDEDAIRFFTGNASTQSTERVNISVGGNVGIGTGSTAGDAKLQVTGTANISGTVTLGNELNATGNVYLTGTNTYIEGTEFISNSETTYVRGTALQVTANSDLGGSNVVVSADHFSIISPTHFTNNVSIDGDLVVLGSSVSITSTSLKVDDNMIYLNAGNTQWTMTQYSGTGLDTVQIAGHYTGFGTSTYAIKITTDGSTFQWSNTGPTGTYNGSDITITGDDQSLELGLLVVFDQTSGYTADDIFTTDVASSDIDLGWVGNYSNSTVGYSHTGIFRDASDATYKFFENYEPEPGVEINTSHASFEYASIAVKNITAANDVTITGNTTHTGTTLFNSTATVNNTLSVTSTGALVSNAGATFNNTVTISPGNTFAFGGNSFTTTNVFTIADASGTALFTGSVFN